MCSLWYFISILEVEQAHPEVGQPILRSGKQIPGNSNNVDNVPDKAWLKVSNVAKACPNVDNVPGKSNYVNNVAKTLRTAKGNMWRYWQVISGSFRRLST